MSARPYAHHDEGCGCHVVSFPGRCVLAVPCDRHAGQVAVIVAPRERWAAFQAWEAAQQSNGIDARREQG